TEGQGGDQARGEAGGRDGGRGRRTGPEPPRGPAVAQVRQVRQVRAVGEERRAGAGQGLPAPDPGAVLMLLTPLIKRQLRIFAVLAVVALGMAFFNYARVPAMLGIGVYDVSVEFADASGLYP